MNIVERTFVLLVANILLVISAMFSFQGGLYLISLEIGLLKPLVWIGAWLLFAALLGWIVHKATPQNETPYRYTTISLGIVIIAYISTAAWFGVLMS